jgi:hypothetical protein
LTLTISVYGTKVLLKIANLFLNENEYSVNRNTVLEQMKSFYKANMKVEEIDQKYQNKDSIVYNYTWHFTQDVKDRERI